MVLKNEKIQGFLLNIQIICRMSIKILKSATQKEKVLTVLDNMIADMISNKNVIKKYLNYLFLYFWKETKRFSCFYHAILFRSTE